MLNVLQRRAPFALLVLLCFGFTVLTWPVEDGTMTPRGAVLGVDAAATPEPVPELTSVPAVYRPERAGFAVRAGEMVIPYRTMGLFVMPGETVELGAVATGLDAAYAAEAEGGTLLPGAHGAWVWNAPQEPGLYPIRITETNTGERIRLNAFVLHPYDRAQGRIGDFRIGNYEPRALHGNPTYLPPGGFVEVTPANRDALVSPHFTLGQFQSKQAGDYPKYLILQENLLVKLELILEEVNAYGVDANTLHVMSGFRTPFYNRSIGNRTTYSQHLYGGAADIFVDENADQYMDDLNGDGRVTEADARVLAEIVEEKAAALDAPSFAGGLGIYGATASHGPFIHVDVRGEPARW